MGLKCFDILKKKIEDETETLSSAMVCNAKKVDKMRKICGVIDKFAGTHETTFCDISIDHSTHEIKISADCDEIILDDKNDKMYAVVGCAKKFTVEQGSSDDTIIFNLVFPGVWDALEG